MPRPKRAIKVKGWAIIGRDDVRDDHIQQQWHGAKSCFIYKIYKTAETARNQLRQIPPEIDARIEEVEITYSIPSPKIKPKK